MYALISFDMFLFQGSSIYSIRFCWASCTVKLNYTSIYYDAFSQELCCPISQIFQDHSVILKVNSIHFDWNVGHSRMSCDLLSPLLQSQISCPQICLFSNKFPLSHKTIQLFHMFPHIPQIPICPITSPYPIFLQNIPNIFQNSTRVGLIKLSTPVLTIQGVHILKLLVTFFGFRY